MDKFTNSGKYWMHEEDKQLNTLYNVDMLDIIEISIIHNRAPGGIISRLSKHDYITNRQSARGYELYKNSDLYKEIVETSKKEKETSKKEATNTDYYIELQNDVKEIKSEINELKNSIKKINNSNEKTCSNYEKINISSLPKVPFGKYEGQPIKTLLNDKNYFEWCKKQKWFQKRYKI